MAAYHKAQWGFNMNILNEALDYLDMEGQIGDVVTVDEYAAKMGSDKDIVTLTFTVKIGRAHV